MISSNPRHPPIRAPLSTRISSALIAACLLSVLALSAYLTPAPQGHGTHMQLGLPRCGWVMALGKPCPTCGMTTAFADAAHIKLLASFKDQPAGCALALLTAAGFWAALHIAVTGSTIAAVLGRLLRPSIVWPSLAFIVGAWVYKIMTWLPDP